MARGESQFLRIFDADGTYYRWQNSYIGVRVSFESVLWDFVDFDADGFTTGQTGDEGGITLDLPGTALTMDAVFDALRNSRLCEIRMFTFDTFLGEEAPQAGQVLTASYIGEVTGGGGPLESLTLELGSSLSPIGAQVPPRNFTTRLIGVPAKL